MVHLEPGPAPHGGGELVFTDPRPAVACDYGPAPARGEAPPFLCDAVPPPRPNDAPPALHGDAGAALKYAHRAGQLLMVCVPARARRGCWPLTRRSPSYLMHSVLPFDGNGTRTSLALNVLVEDGGPSRPCLTLHPKPKVGGWRWPAAPAAAAAAVERRSVYGTELREFEAPPPTPWPGAAAAELPLAGALLRAVRAAAGGAAVDAVWAAVHPVAAEALEAAARAARRHGKGAVGPLGFWVLGPEGCGEAAVVLPDPRVWPTARGGGGTAGTLPGAADYDRPLQWSGGVGAGVLLPGWYDAVMARAHAVGGAAARGGGGCVLGAIASVVL